MKKEEISIKIDKFILLYNSDPLSDNFGKAISELEQLFTNYLILHPQDIDVWIRLIALEFFPEMRDPKLFEKYFFKLLDLKKEPKFYILKALAELLTTYIHEETYQILKSLTPTNKEEKSLIAYMQALFLGPTNKGYKELLIESIKYGNNFVWNHIKLSNFYIYNLQEIEKGYYHIKRAIKNVKVVYNKNIFIDPIDIDEIINEEIKGIHLSYINYNNIVDYLASIEAQLNKIKK